MICECAFVLLYLTPQHNHNPDDDRRIVPHISVCIVSAWADVLIWRDTCSYETVMWPVTQNESMDYLVSLLHCIYDRKPSK